MEQILAARVAMYEQAWIGVDPEGTLLSHLQGCAVHLSFLSVGLLFFLAHDLVSKLIEKDPIERFTADDALEHLWLKVSMDLNPALALLVFLGETVVSQPGCRKTTLCERHLDCEVVM